jgi:LysR family transcriptional regulator, cell division regulator
MSLLAPHLTSFLEVARSGSVSVAAARLHLSQPAVTKQMQALERELGLAVLERAGRGVQLTQAGQLLRDHAQRSAALLKDCRAALDELATGRAGRLTLGAGVTTSILALPAWLRRFRKERPGVDLHIRTGSSQTVERWVLDREIDGGFVTSESQHPDLVITRLFAEEIVLVVAGDSPLRGRVDPARVPLILFPPHTGFRAFLDAHLAAAGQSFDVKMESDSVEAIKAFVRADLGAAYLPETAVRRELGSRALRKLSVRGVPILRRRTSFIRRYDRRPSAAFQHFAAIIRS